MSADLRLILSAVLRDYTLPWDGDHGLAHWARVLEIGERLATSTGACIEVVRLFAVLHDSQRQSEFHDPEHGPRAAEFAKTIRPALIDLSDEEFMLLHRACAGHTHERTHPNVTIQTCWDADRLDLGRVGIDPDPEYLCTEAAKQPAIFDWANDRATRGVFPVVVKETWRIDMTKVASVYRPSRL